MNAPLANDPLLRPYRLKHLTLKNRVMSTSHEPAYSEDGMPKERYRLYHAEKAKGGMALTMTAGSAIVSRDSPAAFGNLHVYRDEIVPWLRELADSCHEHDCKVMIQITHLGRRTGWNKADWLPVLAPSPVREPAHRAFPKTMEDWDIDRIVADYASAAQRCQAAGLDGIEFESYGHLMDGFWSPLTNHRDDEFNGSLDNRLRFTFRVIDAVREAVGPDFIVGIRMVADEDFDKGLSKDEGMEIARRLAASGKFDFLNIIRGMIDTDAALTGVIPITGMASAPHLDFAGEVRRGDEVSGLPRRAHFRCCHGPSCDRLGQARHGRDDPPAHRRSAHRGQGDAGRGAPHPALRRRDLLPRPHLRGWRSALHPQRGDRPRERRCRTSSRAAAARRRRSSWSERGRPAWRQRGSPPSADTRSPCWKRPARPAGKCSLPSATLAARN